MRTLRKSITVLFNTSPNEIQRGYLGLSMIKSYCIIFIVINCGIAVQQLRADDEINGNLVRANWLKENLSNPNVLILDVSPSKIYIEKHIPGAVGVDLYSWYGLQEISNADMEKLYQSWGISAEKKIIMYDQGGTIFATRLFFSLYYHGFPQNNLYVLDGGLSKWQDEGFDVTNHVTPIPPKGSFEIKEIKEYVRARLPETVSASGDPTNNALVEALTPNWHFGEFVMFDKGGHIPNSIMLPSSDLFNADKTFKSPEEIAKILDYLGIKSEQNIYTYCGGGVSASVPFFGLKFILGYPNVKLFKESELGWLKDERELPYWTYDKPFLMRESTWLQAWSGARMRSFGDTQISMIDLRSPEEFYHGHIPFSVSIPAEMFKKNISQLDTLAQFLSKAGISQEDEVVIISGSGITKESALAFLMLEKLNQKKVSIFMDSIDRWKQQGFNVATDTTVAVPKISDNNLAVSGNLYHANFQKSILLTDSPNTEGIFSKIFIASGENIPVRVPTGKVVSVPSANLLNPDGTPKAAKDIWKILETAGVSRYAELVCFSDDPGEAAINYFVLKLIGFPDIKVVLNW